MRVENRLPLSLLITILLATSAASALFGLFSRGGSGPREFLSLHGAAVELYGRGVYAHESSFKAPVFRGTDLVMLVCAVPALVYTARRAASRGLRGSLLLGGVLCCFLYNGFSMAFGASYNALFLVYVTQYSSAFFALLLTLGGLDRDKLERNVGSAGRMRGPAIFLFVASLSPFVWLIDIVAGLVNGEAPRLLGHYTTDVTTALDLGIISPACLMSGVLILRKRTLGYVAGILLLTLLVLIGLVVLGQTALQLLEGVRLSVSDFIIYVGVFVGLASAAVFFLRRLLSPFQGRPDKQAIGG